MEREELRNELKRLDYGTLMNDKDALFIFDNSFELIASERKGRIFHYLEEELLEYHTPLANLLNRYERENASITKVEAKILYLVDKKYKYIRRDDYNQLVFSRTRDSRYGRNDDVVSTIFSNEFHFIKDDASPFLIEHLTRDKITEDFFTTSRAYRESIEEIILPYALLKYNYIMRDRHGNLTLFEYKPRWSGKDWVPDHGFDESLRMFNHSFPSVKKNTEGPYKIQPFGVVPLDSFGFSSKGE